MRRTKHAGVFTSCLALCGAMVFGLSGAPVAADPQPSVQSQLRLAAVLTVISGEVLIRLADGDFSSATDGTVLHVGSTIRTGPDARALITLFEGSTVELQPASEITIEEATARTGSTASLVQSLGRGWYVVTHLMTADSRYELKTPVATASVRGIWSVVAHDDGIDTLTTTPATTLTTTLATTSPRVATTVPAVIGVTVVTPPAATVQANSATEPVRSAVGAVRVRASGFRDGRVSAQTTDTRTKTAEWSRNRVPQIDRNAREDGDGEERGSDQN